MATDVLMPQMGESIAEGTVSKWLKKVGDKIERDEPLLEISTDKVDAEIPSPAAGVLSEIVVQEGQTVAVNSIVARIAADNEQQAANEATKQEVAQEASAVAPEVPAAAAAPAPTGDTPVAPPSPAPKGDTPVAPQKPEAAQTTEDESDDDENVASLDERRRTKSSPLVRKIARENNIDIEQIQGSGVSGRVTKSDILDFLQQPKPAAAAAKAPAPAPAPAPARKEPTQFAQGEKVRLEPLSVMRKKIAQHMVQSKQTSAHVTTVFEFDFSTIEKLRKKHKENYTERGVKITYLPFIIQAVIAGLREFPILNASMDDNNVIYHRDLNIGIAVALEWGLIVPVLKNADEKNILGLARATNDLGDRARSKKLSPDDVQGGTFTITNPGI